MNLHNESGLGFLERLINGFEPVMTELGIGTIPEIFDGDPPHRARGAISQAWSVAALLRMIQRYELMTQNRKYSDLNLTHLRKYACIDVWMGIPASYIRGIRYCKLWPYKRHGLT